MEGQRVFELPIPPSPNAFPTHRWERVKAISRAKRAAFVEACSQHVPSASPPERVSIAAVFRLPAYRDQDNLVASLKPVLDALRLPRRGEGTRWKRGIAERKAFFVADDPEHMSLTVVAQVLEPDPAKQHLRLCITDVSREHEGAA